MLFKQNSSAFAIFLCLNLFFTNVSAQQDSLQIKIEKFDSYEFDEKSVLVNQYIHSDLNDDAVNLFILTYYEFLKIYNFEVYRKSFSNTSFSDDKLIQDSLYFALKINLYDSDIPHAEAIYQKMKESGNKKVKLAAKALSEYYFLIDHAISLKYHEEYLTFNAAEYIKTNGRTGSTWNEISKYFQLLSYNHKYDTILKYCDSILPFKPHSETWLKRKAEAQFHLKKYDQASKTYCELYELKNEFQYMKALLRVYMKLDDTLSIVSLFSENLKIRGENDIEIRKLYFDYLVHFGMHQLKEALLREVLNKKPDFYVCDVPSEAFYYYSLFQFSDKQFDAAIKTLHQAIEMIDTTSEKSPYISNYFSPIPFYSVFESYLFRADGTMLVSKYYNQMGWIYARQRQTNKSIKHYKKALVYFDCNSTANYALAAIYKYGILRNDKKGVRYFEKIASCKLFGWSDYYYEAISELAQHYYKQKQLERAKETLLSGIAHGGSLASKDYKLLSSIYKEEGNYAEAFKMVEMAIEKSEEEWQLEWYNELKIEIEHLMKAR